jgi:hypothetical protein
MRGAKSRYNQADRQQARIASKTLDKPARIQVRGQAGFPHGSGRHLDFGHFIQGNSGLALDVFQNTRQGTGLCPGSLPVVYFPQNGILGCGNIQQSIGEAIQNLVDLARFLVKKIVAAELDFFGKVPSEIRLSIFLKLTKGPQIL